MPRRTGRCTHGGPQRRTSNRWVVAETLDHKSIPSVILDGRYRRHFANLGRASIATSAAHARHLTPLVRRCADNRRTEHELLPLPSGSVLRLTADPIFGPSQNVFGVNLSAGPPTDTPTPPPTIGAIEWDVLTARATISPDFRTLLDISEAQLDSPTTVPNLISHFDRWDDRTGFLALFDLTNPAGTWIGTATTQFTGKQRHNLHIVAKRIHGHRLIRALVCDISPTDPPPPPDPIYAALRRAPITPGHALGIIDLHNGLIHEWIADEPFAHWRNSTPQLHPDDIPVVATARTRLLSKTSTTTITARIRFDRASRWILVQAVCTRITDDDRPQALIDVTFSR
ncbi:GAF domain-containing protein [Nocardia macrotermitis]|nr:GAF domain-containing protein [Nocardia macrotermitis]